MNVFRRHPFKLSAAAVALPALVAAANCGLEWGQALVIAIGCGTFVWEVGLLGTICWHIMKDAVSPCEGSCNVFPIDDLSSNDKTVEVYKKVG
jgi:hypothetical protein